MKGIVKWDSCFSNLFEIKRGIRQGGIISPGYFIIYINDLIVELRMSGLGCHLARNILLTFIFCWQYFIVTCIGCLIAVNTYICSEFAVTIGLYFNHKKPFNKDRTIILSEITKLNFRRGKLEWINEAKYLCVVFNGVKTLIVDANINCRKFVDTSFTIPQKYQYFPEKIFTQVNLIKLLTFAFI